MKIFVHDYAGHPFQVQLSRELARRGHQVRHAFAAALQTPRGELARSEADPDPFEIGEIAMDPRYADWKYKLIKRRSLEIKYGKTCADLIRQWRPEIVVSSNTPTESQGSLVRASREIDAKFVYWVQDFYSLAVEKILAKKLPLIGRCAGQIYRKMDRKQFAESAHIIPITDDFSPILKEEFGVPAEKITAIPNWAPIASLPVCEKRNSWALENGLADHFVFLYTGTLGMKHNPNLLLALAEKFRDHANVSVVVISEGIGSDWLTKQKEVRRLDNLQLLPYQPFERMPEVMACGDVLLCVLEEDAGVFSVPSKVLTYLCASRPLLLAVPEVNLAARIVCSQNAGIAVPPASEREFVNAAESLYRDETLRTRMGQNARRYAEENFQIEDIGDRFEKILADL